MRTAKRATIKEVARMAGTSTATVSRVLNATGYVSNELKRRVYKAAEELGYSPNGVARSLKSRNTHTVGVVISDISNPFFAAVVRGVEDTLVKHQYHPLLCNTDRDIKKEEMYLRLLCEKRVDGILISAACREGAHMQILRQQGIPWVFINRRPEGFGGPAVLTDNRAGAFEATMHLITLGHRRIATIAGPQNINTGVDRLAGFKEAMHVSELGLPESAIIFGDFQEDSGYRGAIRIMEMPLDQRPTALFVANNQMTVGALRAFKERGVKIPDELAIVGFDEAEWARIVAPPLTTVEQPSYRMGVFGKYFFHKMAV